MNVYKLTLTQIRVQHLLWIWLVQLTFAKSASSIEHVEEAAKLKAHAQTLVYHVNIKYSCCTILELFLTNQIAISHR
jgi:hypothetical protein